MASLFMPPASPPRTGKPILPDQRDPLQTAMSEKSMRMKATGVGSTIRAKRDSAFASVSQGLKTSLGT